MKKTRRFGTGFITLTLAAMMALQPVGSTFSTTVFAEEMEDVKEDEAEAAVIETEAKEDIVIEETEDAIDPVTVSVKEEVKNEAVKTYTITWKDDDGSVLEVDTVEAGTIPVFQGGVPVKAAEPGYTYTFKSWSPAVVAAASNKTYKATYTKTAIKYNVTVHFENIMNANGTTKSSTQSNALSAGTGWSFTQKKLDNLIPVKKFSVDGITYEYKGQWQYADGTVFTPPFSISGKDLTSDVDIYICPVYEKQEIWYLNYNYIDNVSTGSGSWANQGMFNGFSHTFRQPEAQKHYSFVKWMQEDNGAEFRGGDKYTYPSEYMVPGVRMTINTFAYWQPSATVNYRSFDGSLIEEVEKFEDIAVYGFEAPAIEGAEFTGWYAGTEEDAELISEDAALSLPEITKDKVERTILDVYAHYNTSYTVEHYLQNAEDDEYTLADSETVENVMAGTDASAEAREYEGFTFAEESEDNVLSSEVSVNGDTVLKLFYNRNEYTVTYIYEGEVPEDATALPEVTSVRFGQAVEIAEDAEAEGYTFSGWDAEDFEMPAEDIVISGSFEKIPEAPAAPAVIEDSTPSDPGKPGKEVKPAPAPRAEEAPRTDITPAAEEAPAAEVAEAIVPAAPAVIAPQAPSAPAAVTAPAVTSEVIKDTEAPKAVKAETVSTIETAETIEDTAVPQAAQRKSWAIVNLIAAIAAGIMALGMIVTFFRRKKEEAQDGSEEKSERKTSKLLGIIPAAAAAILFLLTEDMSAKMILTDRWTLIMVLIAAIGAVLAVATRNRKEEKENEEFDTIVNDLKGLDTVEIR